MALQSFRCHDNFFHLCLDKGDIIEKDFTGITIYANRSSYYDPEKDEIYRTVDEFIRFKLNEFPEWFIFRGETSDLDKYMIKK